MHIPHKIAAKPGKGRFSDQKILTGLRVRKIDGEYGDRLHSGYQYAEPHSRHWPESSIKARRPMPAANAVCAQCALARDLSGKMSRAAGIRFTPFYWPASIGLRTFRGPSANAGWAVRRIERLARVLQLSFWPCPARLRRYLGGRRRRAGRSARVAPW